MYNPFLGNLYLGSIKNEPLSASSFFIFSILMVLADVFAKNTHSYENNKVAVIHTGIHVTHAHT